MAFKIGTDTLCIIDEPYKDPISNLVQMSFKSLEVSYCTVQNGTMKHKYMHCSLYK